MKSLITCALLCPCFFLNLACNVTAEQSLGTHTTANMQTIQDYIGLTLEKAQALADQRKVPHRVVMIDGKPLRVTHDIRPNRLNFTVEKGKVTAVRKG